MEIKGKLGDYYYAQDYGILINSELREEIEEIFIKKNSKSPILRAKHSFYWIFDKKISFYLLFLFFFLIIISNVFLIKRQIKLLGGKNV